MKNPIHQLLSLLIIVAFFSIFSCSDKMDDMTLESSTLLNKWWYASDVTADIFISSNGDFEQTDGTAAAKRFFGEWVWIAEANLILKVDYMSGQGAGQPTEAWLRFSNLTENTVNVEQSLTGEAGSYQGPFEYTTEK